MKKIKQTRRINISKRVENGLRIPPLAGRKLHDLFDEISEGVGGLMKLVTLLKENNKQLQELSILKATHHEQIKMHDLEMEAYHQFKEAWSNGTIAYLQ